jgi:hypothetical protein
MDLHENTTAKQNKAGVINLSIKLGM